MKKVLIIAYYFPPIGGGGVQRALKMAKYIGEFGWEPHILTVAPQDHVSLDETLLDQLPEGVHIHRCAEWSLGRRWLRQAVPVKQKPSEQPASSDQQKNVARSGFKARLLPLLKRAKMRCSSQMTR